MIELAKKTIENYIRSKEEGNFELLSSCFLQSNELVYIGSDENEFWKGWEAVSKYLKQQLEAFKNFKSKVKSFYHKTIVEGKTYLFVEESEISVEIAGSKKKGNFITTYILEKTGEDFKISFLHRSHPSKEPIFPYSLKVIRYF